MVTLTETERLIAMGEDIKEIKGDLKDLQTFQLAVVSAYVTRAECQNNCNACKEMRRQQEDNLKWGVGVILTLGGMTIATLAAIGGWFAALNGWFNGGK